ncbi:MAG TPA: TonB-dependent receptor, partial [Bacteroidia bacterium]|nr:TonB-dependent receptor [Bacteroidia bacterium]
MKRLALSLFLLLSSILHVPLTAQGNATVHGRIIDSLSQKPIAFAVIALQKPGDEFPSSTLSNDSGMFRVNLPDTGTYKVIITLLGYKTITNENIVVHGELDLGTILFAHDSHYLDATTIVAQQDIVENTPDMVIYHADKDVTTEGSTAIDLLKKVPGVTVDINGNIELMGSSGLRIFINGKPSVLMASHPVDVLQAIPADQIKSIEIISNPSAKYDAQGTGGIINIVLKKNVLPGVNGNISGTIGSRIEQGNATISYEHDDFSVSADLGGNYYIPQDGSSSFTRTATVNDTTGNLIQNGTTNSGRQNYYPTIELGWELGDNDEISASVGYEDFRNDGTSVTDVNTFSDPGNDSVFLRKTGSNRTNETSLEYNVDYSHTFDTLGKELDLSMEFSGDRDSSDYRTDQSFLHSSQPIDPSSYEFSQLENDLGKEAEYLFTADLILPFDEDHTLEFGGKAN